MRTVGIEEELIVVGLDDGHPLAVGDIVVDRATSDAASQSVLSASQFEAEFKKEQAELGSSPSRSLTDVGRELHDLRLRMNAAADRHRAAVVAIASSPFKVSPTASAGARYTAMMDRFGLLARQQLTCGQHVHVSISSPEEGVAVLDRIRPWLALLTALSANSPFWQGQDSAYASYRSVMWGLWPTAGPTERFGSVQGYERAVHERLAAGAAMDQGMLYFDARLSARYPTVEIRVPDVCTDIADALLIAALARALVDTAAADWVAGRAAPDVSVGLLRAAAWRAARFGMTAELVDTGTAQAMPAWTRFDQLIAYVTDALRANGDSERVSSGAARLAATGTGAEFQRRSFARRGRFADVVTEAAERTVGAGSSDAPPSAL